MGLAVRLCWCKLAAYFPCHQERPVPDRLYELDGLGLPPAEYEDIQADLR
jgi:hypothetical protein